MSSLGWQNNKRTLCVLAFLLYFVNTWGQRLPYNNPNLNSEERANELIYRLALEEKAAWMCDVSDAIPRKCKKKFNWWSEVLHAHDKNNDVTVFPEPIGIAACFDDELVSKIFDEVSDEIRAAARCMLAGTDVECQWENHTYIKTPLFTKAGSIVPMGKFIQYTRQISTDTLEIRIYPGADAEFTLYENENDNYNYEKGFYATIKFNWDDAGKSLTIKEREGTYPGILSKRTFNIILVDENKGIGINISQKYDKVINYTGKKTVSIL